MAMQNDEKATSARYQLWLSGQRCVLINHPETIKRWKAYDAEFHQKSSKILSSSGEKRKTKQKKQSRIATMMMRSIQWLIRKNQQGFPNEKLVIVLTFGLRRTVKILKSNDK